MNEQPQKKNMTTIWIVVASVLLLVVLVAAQVIRTNPDRVLNQFLTAIEEGDRGTAMALVSDDIEPYRRENISYFVEDWTNSKTVTYEITKEEAWRQRYLTEKNENGDEVNVLNQYGDRDREIEPTPRNFAGFYHAELTVEYDKDQDPVIVTLRRKGDNRWSRLGTTLRGWEIVRMQYNISDEEIDLLDDQFFEFEGADELDFEIDEDGNLVLPDDEGLILEDGSTEKDGEAAEEKSAEKKNDTKEKADPSEDNEQ